ncbi:hypothetical protein F9K77_01125 [Ochrobactrum sp. LMG 5442]|nr:hypothetical protein F9K77_01125 [Ochrobactrum sp. LMG 5442]
MGGLEMDVNDLSFVNLTSNILKRYQKRAPTESAQFLRWFLENIFRQDSQEADDACVDKKQDKGIDGILVNDVVETIYIFQSKVKQSEKATLGDTDLKEFFGTLTQFSHPDSIQVLLDGAANAELKSALQRDRVKEKVQAGYQVEGVFCCNVALNSDGKDYLKTCPELKVYDAVRICEEHIDLGAKSGVSDKFRFDVSDTEVVKYQTAENIRARIFLANALQLLHMNGISDGTLFSQNVRLSLGNTKVNKSLTDSIKNKAEHKNFPLYHNGITVLCGSFSDESDNTLEIQDYVVVNGAQSLTSLMNAKSSITKDLRILVKVVELSGNDELSDKITQYSNNQNAIKARDMKSNNPIQERLKKEIEALSYNGYAFEVKRGELNKGKTPISNEDAGLALLAMDIGEPWSCHQKYKVMDDSHSKIFGRSDVTGAKIVAFHEMMCAIDPVLDEFEDKYFGHYTLTKYFLAYAVSEIIKSDPEGVKLFRNFDRLFKNGNIDKFVTIFAELASTTVNDLNAEVADQLENEGFDHKRDLKSQKWSKAMCEKLKAAYAKDVKRKRATPIHELLSGLN